MKRERTLRFPVDLPGRGDSEPADPVDPYEAGPWLCQMWTHLSIPLLLLRKKNRMTDDRTRVYELTPDMTQAELTAVAEWCGGIALVELGRVEVKVPTPEGLLNAFPGDRIVGDGHDFQVEAA